MSQGGSCERPCENCGVQDQPVHQQGIGVHGTTRRNSGIGGHSKKEAGLGVGITGPAKVASGGEETEAISHLRRTAAAQSAHSRLPRPKSYFAGDGQSAQNLLMSPHVDVSETISLELASAVRNAAVFLESTRKDTESPKSNLSCAQPQMTPTCCHTSAKNTAGAYHGERHSISANEESCAYVLTGRAWNISGPFAFGPVVGEPAKCILEAADSDIGADLKRRELLAIIERAR